MMQFNLRNGFSLKTLLALMLVFTCVNLIHTKNFYEISFYEARKQSQESEASDNDSRHYAVLNRYEEYVEESNPAEAKKFYASHHGDYPANLKLRDAIENYGFYWVDKYQNIHHLEAKHINAILRDETLLFQKCDWFSLSAYSYHFSEAEAIKYCSPDYIKVSDDPVLSEAIKKELADKETSADSNRKTDYKIARDETVLRFLELFLASLAISLVISFLIRKYWPTL